MACVRFPAAGFETASKQFEMASDATTTVREAGPMGKGMSIAGMVIGGLVALMFTLDAAIGIPFGVPGMTFPNVGLALGGAILAYLGWSAFRDAQ
jgi:hypothetical protein